MPQYYEPYHGDPYSSHYSQASSNTSYNTYYPQDSPLSASSGGSEFDFVGGTSFSSSPYDGLDMMAYPHESRHHHSERSARHSSSSSDSSHGTNVHDHGSKYPCLVAGCNHNSTRAYDLDRHMNAKHKSLDKLAEDGKMFDCPHSTCPSKGRHGFKRRDHLRDHTRRMHGRELSEDGLGKKYVATEKKKRTRH